MQFLFKRVIFSLSLILIVIFFYSCSNTGGMGMVKLRVYEVVNDSDAIYFSGNFIESNNGGTLIKGTRTRNKIENKIDQIYWEYDATPPLNGELVWSYDILPNGVAVINNIITEAEIIVSIDNSDDNSNNNNNNSNNNAKGNIKIFYSESDPNLKKLITGVDIRLLKDGVVLCSIEQKDIFKNLLLSDFGLYILRYTYYYKDQDGNKNEIRSIIRNSNQLSISPQNSNETVTIDGISDLTGVLFITNDSSSDIISIFSGSNSLIYNSCIIDGEDFNDSLIGYGKKLKYRLRGGEYIITAKESSSKEIGSYNLNLKNKEYYELVVTNSGIAIPNENKDNEK